MGLMGIDLVWGPMIPVIVFCPLNLLAEIWVQMVIGHMFPVGMIWVLFRSEFLVLLIFYLFRLGCF